MSDPVRADFIVVGAGIAGASVAYWLAPHGRVVILERESQPGYHSTGRSAALFIETYGPAPVRSLTCASRRFFASPPAGFSESPLLRPRGELLVGSVEQREQFEQYCEELRGTGITRRLDREATCSLVPVLRRERVIGSLHEPEASDIDVHALHQGYLCQVRRLGGIVACDSEVTQMERSGSDWIVQAGDASYSSPVVLNAAGAWADRVAILAGAAALGVRPMRRSAFTFAAPAGLDISSWPAVMSAGDDWYFKPEAGMFLASPSNADPVEPHDVQAEEMDIAMAIDRIETMTTLSVRRPARVWAGLRSFVSDGSLVGGYDDRVPGFFWVAAQGGYGIQTSAAMGEACAALARGRPIPGHLSDFGVTAESLSPARPLSQHYDERLFR